jgi:predicted amidophosphoribosyltransferase
MMLWTKIDETTRTDHYYLGEDDNCFHLREYSARKGYKFSQTNQLVFNFKCKPSVCAADSRRKHYKDQSIRQFAADLRSSISQPNVGMVTWVPVPPSKVPGHVEYDDRLERVLHTAFAGYDADIRCLLRQRESVEADHASDDRIGEPELRQLLEIDHAALAARPLRQHIVLFDDVITTGKHFKCCEHHIQTVAPPGVPIFGLFIARSVRPPMFEELDDSDLR